MPVVAVSRGTFSGGKLLAESLSRALGYRCIDREALLAGVAAHGVSREELLEALEKPPGVLERFNHKRYIYLTLVRAELIDQVRSGNAIYHGLGGHLLLGGVPGVLRLRVIAPMEFRIARARERLRTGHAEAISHIQRMDQERRRWTRYLYGVDWADPSLYDFVVNLAQVSIEQACAIVVSMTRMPAFRYTPERQAALDNLALCCRVRAALALDPQTAALEVRVEARAGAVSIAGELFGLRDAVERVARAVPGVTAANAEEQPAADAGWPWALFFSRSAPE